MFEPAAPVSGAQIAHELAHLDGEITDYFSGFDAALFLTAQGNKWSPADHLRHLTKSMRPLAQGMRVPGVVLGLRFGWARRPSLEYQALEHRYEERLAQGAVAGRFAPSALSSPSQGEAGRSRILEQWRGADRDLLGVIARWSEKKLDRYQAPHPALGKLTIREMLFFTIFHNAHHARLVMERLER